MNDSTFDSLTIQIPVTPKRDNLYTVIDSIDSDLVKYKWHSNSRGYVLRQRRITDDFSSKVMFIHRIIMGRILGRDLLSSEFVDHIDGDPLNNTRENLRPASQSQNLQNQRVSKNSKTGYKGVIKNRRCNTWEARIGYNGKQISLGYFKTPELAAEAYNQAAIVHHGEFARLNVIPDKDHS